MLFQPRRNLRTHVILRQYLGRTVPVQLILPMFPSYVVSGPESISTFFRDSKSGDLSGVNRGVKWGTDAFGCPAHSIHLFKPPKKEISLLLSGIVHTGLSDPNLSAMTSRFQEFLIQLIEKDTPGKVGDNWVELPDLTAFVEKYVFDATICAMFGTHILRLNPNFAEEFWEFDRNIGSLFMGVPRWFKPQAHRAREKILERIKTWVIYTKKNCDIENVKDLDWEPFYGSRFNRERQGVLTMRGILDETARASDNLAFIWA